MTRQEPEQRAQNVLALRGPCHRLDMEWMQSEQRGRERSGPHAREAAERRETPGESEEEHDVEDVQQQIREVRRARRATGDLPHELMAVPGERHPVRAMKRGPGGGG